MTETQSANQVRDELQKLFECPVCVQVFRNPKLLPCGHSICADCCVQLNRDRISLLCPVCRRPSTVVAEKLPINFGLRDLVNHYSDNNDAKKFSCKNCDRRITEDDCWSCHQCNNVICSYCAVKAHSQHSLKEIKELLRDKENELTKWRDDVSQIKKQIISVRQQIDGNQSRLNCALRLLKSTLTSKLAPQFDNNSKTLSQEFINIQGRYDSVNAVRLIMEDAKNREDFMNLKVEFQNFLEKQLKLRARQTEALVALRKCETSLSCLITAEPGDTVAPGAFHALSGSNANCGARDVNNSPDAGAPRRLFNTNQRTLCGTRFANLLSPILINDGGSIIRCRRPRNTNHHGGPTYFPDLVHVENDTDDSLSAAVASNAGVPHGHLGYNGSSDEEIHLENYFIPQMDNNDPRNRTGTGASQSPLDCTTSQQAARNHMTDESDTEETINIDDAAAGETFSARHGGRKNWPLTRFFNQIERRMNSDLDDDGHLGMESVIMDTDRNNGAPTIDMLDDIVMAPAPSSIEAGRRTHNVEAPSTSTANRTERNAAGGASTSHKRGRMSPALFHHAYALHSQSDSSEGEHVDGEDEDDEPIDSAIRFRILRKR